KRKTAMGGSKKRRANSSRNNAEEAANAEGNLSEKQNIQGKPKSRAKVAPCSTESGLQYVEAKAGNGPNPKHGQNVFIRYKGMIMPNGYEFDSGTLQFHLGKGEVIAGLDEGVATMRPGGMRKLLIPPHLGYGSSGAPPKIPPNAVLVFDVDLKRIGTRREVAEARENAQWAAFSKKRGISEDWADEKTHPGAANKKRNPKSSEQMSSEGGSGASSTPKKKRKKEPTA
ncbi:hypothetical protein CYMTET_51029, partial [Cymbomonas tetramitiformis]